MFPFFFRVAEIFLLLLFVSVKEMLVLFCFSTMPRGDINLASFALWFFCGGISLDVRICQGLEFAGIPPGWMVIKFRCSKFSKRRFYSDFNTVFLLCLSCCLLLV